MILSYFSLQRIVAMPDIKIIITLNISTELSLTHNTPQRQQPSYWLQLGQLDYYDVVIRDSIRVCFMIVCNLSNLPGNMDIFKIERHQKIVSWNCKLTSPLATASGSYCVSENGDVLKIQSEAEPDNNDPEVLFTILGCPSAIAFRALNGSFLIADLAHQSIFLRDDHEIQQIHNLITEYNERAFSGPSSLAVNDYYNHLYFTDSGPFGETSIDNPAGSLFLYNFDDKTLRALAFRKLACPCGIVLDPEQKFLLLCEMGENRIIKFLLDEGASGNYTVFHQFSGRMGPSAICFNNGYYYVSLFEFNDVNSQGLLAILNSDGDLVQKVKVPTGAEITGIQFLPPSIQNNNMTALVTEGCALYEVTFKGDRMETQEESDVGIADFPK